MYNIKDKAVYSGNPASFVGKAGDTIGSITASIAPIQDLHGYDAPWPGGGGVNLVGLNTSPNSDITYHGVSATSHTDDTVTLTSSGNITYAQMGLYYTLKAGTYTASVKATSSDEFIPIVTIYYYPGSTLIVSGIKQGNPKSFTLTEDTAINIRFFATTSSAAERTVTFYDFQLESGSTPSSWTPYSNICPITGFTGANIYVSPTQNQADATVYNVNWTSEAGTVYGGTVDVVSGKLTVTMASVDMGTLSWQKSTSAGHERIWNGGIKTVVKKPDTNNMKANIVCSIFDADTANNTYSHTKDNTVSIGTDGVIYCYSSSIYDEPDVGTALSGVQLVYELATPVEYTLTPQEVTALLGQNYVWSDLNSTVSVTVLSDSVFHTLSIADSPKTRCRIYFIGDGVDCTDDDDVQTNGTLLVGAAGDTDSNGRIGQDGITFTEMFNPDKNIQIGTAVSYQIGMTLLNTDGALNGFSYGRCKVYLDVYDAANSAWRVCPMGVFVIDIPTKRKVQLVSATGYDQMQLLDAICDSWWSGLNWSGGITLSALLTSMANQIGVKVSTATASAILNSSVSYMEAPFACVEVTYREVLEYIAEATGTIARFDRDGYLDLRFFSAAKIGGNTVTVNADTVGNTCLDIDIAEYQAAAIDLLKVKIAEDDIGVTVGSGTNQYTIVNNLFLYGSTATIITNRATPIYNRLNGLGAYTPIQAKLIYDWSLEAGDIINIVRDSTTYPVLIFQQTLAWRGGYVTADILADGDNVRPVMDYNERASYRMASEMSQKVGDNEIISKINQTAESIQIQASRVDLAGYVTFTNLSTSGQTTVNGGNITTGTIDASTVTVSNINASNISSGTLSAARIGAGSITANKLDSADINASKILTVGSMTDAAAATVLNSNIAIGGRNLCTGTAVSNEFTKSPGGNWFVPYGVWPISTYGGAAFADTANTQWTASFDYSITGVDTAFTLYISPKTAAESGYSGWIAVASIPVGSSSGHAEGTGTITDGERDYAGTSGVLFGMGYTNANAVMTVSNLKVEIGNKATSWTQAPEDVAADIATAQSTAEGANSQEQLIYRSKAVGTTSISGTTTWVTNTTGNQDTWTIKRPQYNTSYPVMFIATQRKTVGGTVTCTTPQIDDTITVIDGGNIITGTVTASQIAGGTITSTNLATALNNTINTAYSNASDALSNAATAQSTAESANSQEQLIYISKVSGTTTQSATTTWVTDTTGNQNTWTIKRPTYNSSYPVLFVATQRKSVGGTVTCTTPQIDNTTTVIDGGHITTGTIDASVVSVTNLNASNITSGTMSASKINGGDLVLGGSNNTNGTMTVKDANGNTAATVTNAGIVVNGTNTKTTLNGGAIVIEPPSDATKAVTIEYVSDGLAQSMYLPSGGRQENGFWWNWGTYPAACLFIPGGDRMAAQQFAQDLGLGPNGANGAFLVDSLAASEVLTPKIQTPTSNQVLTITGFPDVTNRRTNAVELSSFGWYRAIKVKSNWAASNNFSIDIYIGRKFDYINNEQHRITLVANYNSFSFVGEMSESNTRIISNIRYTHDSDSGYIDIYYNSISLNGVVVDFDVHCRPDLIGDFVPQSLYSVGDSPSGETVATEYTFAANTLGPSIGQYSERITSFLSNVGLGNYYHAFSTTTINIKPRNVLAVFTDWAEGSNSVTGFTDHGNTYLYVSFVNDTPCTVYITYIK